MEKNKSDFWSKLNSDVSLGKVLNDKAKEHFYNEFSSLMDAGLDIQRSLEIIIDEQDKKKRKELFETIKKNLISGSSLASAMENSGVFSTYEYQSVRIGEESGRLNQVLIYLGKYFEDKVKLRKHLIGVFTYPAFVLLVTIGVLYFMLNTVVPMFQEVFQQFGKELPYLTQKIIMVSENFSSVMLIIFIILVGVIALHWSQRKEIWYRKLTGTIILRLPLFGNLFRKIYLARFTQSMELLIVSRTPLVKSLELVSEMINFYPIEEALSTTKAEILKGNSLHSGLQKYKIFDKRFISLIKIAEEINQLEKTFNRMTKQLNDDIDHQTKVLGTLIEPFIIIIIGGIVGLIMVAMYLPMFNMTDVIQ